MMFRQRIILAFGIVVCLFSAVLLQAQENEVLAQSDDLDWEGSYKEEKQMLLSSMWKFTDPVMMSEVYWRLSRATLNDGEADQLAGRVNTDQALKLYEEGEGYADIAIRYNPQNPNGYFWKSANMGMWGQTRGVLDSLFKVGPMFDNLKAALEQDRSFPDAFYVLGELYEKAPGWPISLGNIEYAVSLSRKAIDLMELQVKTGKRRGRLYVYYVGLASHLWNRNWDAKRRANAQADQRRQFNERKDYLEKHFFYEGTVAVKNISDREEAREILIRVIGEIEAMPNRTAGQEEDLKKARELLQTFK